MTSIFKTMLKLIVALTRILIFVGDYIEEAEKNKKKISYLERREALHNGSDE